MIGLERSILTCLVVAWPQLLADGPPTPANGHRMIGVSAGEYRIGEAGHAANPERKARIEAFFIADAETTNAQFAAFVAESGYVTDAETRGYGMVSREGMMDWEWEKVPGACWRFPEGPDGTAARERADHPVTQISGRDAEAYCRWLGARLPTLEEWEVAARAGSGTRYPWGDQFEVRRANIWNGDTHRKNTRKDGFVHTAPVRSFPPNAWGLYDVIGNVFEYCTGPAGDRAGAFARGGSWWCSAGTCGFYNLVDIGAMDSHASFGNQGFRVAMEGAGLAAPTTSIRVLPSHD